MITSGSEVHYRAVGANGTENRPTERNSGTDDEMLDISTEAPFNYTDIADKSQGQYLSHL